MNYTSDAFGFILDLQQQDDEMAGNCSVLKASNSFVTWSSQLSIDHSLRELRLLWDPGATKLPIMFMTAAGATKLPCVDIYKPTMVQILLCSFVQEGYPFLNLL